MCQYHSLKTLHDDWSECYWPVVIQADRLALLGKGDDGCGLEAGGNSAVREGKVEDGGENISQFVGTGTYHSTTTVINSYIVRPQYYHSTKYCYCTTTVLSQY